MVRINISIGDGSQPQANDITFEWYYEKATEIFRLILQIQQLASKDRSYLGRGDLEYQEKLDKKIELIARLVTELQAARSITPEGRRFFRDGRIVHVLWRRYGEEFKARVGLDEPDNEFAQWLMKEPVQFLVDGLLAAGRARR